MKCQSKPAVFSRNSLKTNNPVTQQVTIFRDVFKVGSQILSDNTFQLKSPQLIQNKHSVYALSDNFSGGLRRSWRRYDFQSFKNWAMVAGAWPAKWLLA